MEIINSKMRDFVQKSHILYKKRYFQQKVRNTILKSVKVEKIDNRGLNNIT